jgi:metallophosphoesterase (TIGR03767 family)
MSTDWVLRNDLCAGAPGGTPLLTVAHLSDLHVCDHQSPARVEFLDRWADPDSPILDQLGEVGTYRPQDMLTAQVLDAMVRAVNAVPAGPIGGAPLDWAIVTGDNTDNTQANELAWYLALLEGGAVRPDSGAPDRYEGVADDCHFDERFWHPDGRTRDLPRSRWGLPQVPGLLDAIRTPFAADGLNMPWLAVHGNHDQLLQGTVPALAWLSAAATGGAKPIGLPAGWTPDAVLRLLAGLELCDPAAIAALGRMPTRPVTADAGRRMIGLPEFLAAHFGPAARPPGHGFTPGALNAYYRYDHGQTSVLTLNTVNPHGGWEGSLDEDQLAWLASELDLADSEHRYVVLASHHPLHRMVNDRTDGVDRRVLAAQFSAELVRHPSLVLWLNGHTHRAAVQPRGSFWEVTAPSLIDWPQQGRIVEVLRGDGRLSIAVSMLDHAGESPWTGSIDSPCALAGLSRQLAGADWQQPGRERAGAVADRDAVLLLADPWA